MSSEFPAKAASAGFPNSRHSGHTFWTVYFQAAWQGGLHFCNNSNQLRKEGWRILDVWDSTLYFEQRRGGKLQGHRSPEKELCLLSLLCRSSNNPAKWSLLTPLQKVTGVHSSCSPHNQSFLFPKRPGIHAGVCIVHLASWRPTPHALAPTQRKRNMVRPVVLTYSYKDIQASAFQAVCLAMCNLNFGDILHICNIFINNNNQKINKRGLWIFWKRMRQCNEYRERQQCWMF